MKYDVRQMCFISTRYFFICLQVKKHDAFEKLVYAQEEKLDTLKNHGSKLIEQNHFDSPHIKKRIDEVVLRRGRVKDATK